MESIHKLIVDIWRKEQIPKEWKNSIICPLYKKVDKQNCSNHRGISLLNTGYKVFTNILNTRLKEYAERIIGEYQAGFGRNRSTAHQIHTLKLILEKCWEYDVEIYQIFIDFKQAYDSINRNMLLKAIQELGLARKIRNLESQ